MKYIIVVDSNNKVLLFRENREDLLEVFLKSQNKEITKDNYFTKEEWDKFNVLRHIPNALKTEKQFREYTAFCKRVGLPKPDRASSIRPLHEKYNESGNLIK